MFNITFFKFSKRPNATKQPTIIDGKSYNNCRVKTDSSIINPVIEIAVEKTSSASDEYLLFDYNYCYISKFKRYYYINDVVFSQGIWVVSCSVDILATYKSSIKSSSQFIIRTSHSDYINGNLIDSFYNSYPNNSQRYSEQQWSSDTVERYRIDNQTWYDADYFLPSATGYVIVSVFSGGTNGIQYYAFSRSEWDRFVARLQSYTPSDMGDLPNGVGQALYDPIQYITSVKWYPFRPYVSAPVTNVYIGRINFTVTAGEVFTFDNSILDTFRIHSLTIPKHPQSNNYPYMNLSPYTEYSLYFEPYGVIPLDSSLLYGETSIDLKWQLDYTNGATVLQITSSVNQSKIIAQMTGQIGVDLPVSKVNVDVKTGLLLGGMDYLASKGASLISTEKRVNTPIQPRGGVTPVMVENISSIAGGVAAGLGLGDAQKTVQSITDGLVSVVGNLRVAGNQGSFISYRTKPVLRAYYMTQIDHDLDRFGAPCQSLLPLNPVNGYVICDNASLTFTGDTNLEPYPLEAEKLALISFLNNGIYLD